MKKSIEPQGRPGTDAAFYLVKVFSAPLSAVEGGKSLQSLFAKKNISSEQVVCRLNVDSVLLSCDRKRLL